MTRTAAAAVLLSAVVFAQTNPSWLRPFPAHKIAGNVYYVGTEDLACYLLTSPDGHILINTGLADSTPLIREGIQKMGYRLEDVKILLTMQAHFDHVAAMGEIQRITGAQAYATEADAPILESGGRSDPFVGVTNPFAPIKVSRRLKDGDHVRLGRTDLRVILMPGHTPGSVGYETAVDDGGRKRSLLFVNVPTVVTPLVGNKSYPNIVQDFESTFQKLRQLKPDIWVAAHASQYGMAGKAKAGSFVDPTGYAAAIAGAETAFRERLAKERSR
jgi:metallo-beta-lactamase class B